jgi:hypothetical protein
LKNAVGVADRDDVSVRAIGWQFTAAAVFRQTSRFPANLDLRL